MADVESVVRTVSIVPEFLYRAGIDRPDVVRHGHIKDTVRQNGRSLDRLTLAGLEAPNLLEPGDIVGSNLSEAGMPLTGVSAVKGEPAIGRRVEQVVWIDALGSRFPLWSKEGQSDQNCETQQGAHAAPSRVFGGHFNVSR